MAVREKKRYMVYEIVGPQFPVEQAKKAIVNALLKYCGEFGYAKTHLSVIENTYKGNKGIIKVRNAMVNEVKAALAMIRQISGSPATMRTIGISGSIKKAK